MNRKRKTTYTLFTATATLSVMLGACEAESEDFTAPAESALIIDGELEVEIPGAGEILDADEGYLAIAAIDANGETCGADQRPVRIADDVDPEAALSSLCFDESFDLESELVLRHCAEGEVPIGLAGGLSVQASEPDEVPVTVCTWCESNTLCFNGRPAQRAGFLGACPWNKSLTCCIGLPSGCC